MRATSQTLWVSALVALVGCATPPDRNACAGVVEIPCTGGSFGPSGEWMTSDWTGPRINYPAYTTFRLCHGLNRLPTSVEVMGSFTPDGILAQLIGNPASIITSCGGQPGVTTNSILLRNGGGQDFYARIVVR